jgi:sugar (pentulose or hexulose) kinase
MRNAFALTGSPRLPAGLNLGCQLLWLQTLAPDKFARGTIVTWPQFWAWRLSGVAATEVTALGCHTDLWVPSEGKPSPMAVMAGWAERFAPLRQARDVLGPATLEWRDRCELPDDCAVLCGLHDSNAALLAARGFPEVGEGGFTLLSTGTWFVAMRSVRERCKIDLASLPESRDCLVNVDVTGMPVPSARFMGGREAEILESPFCAPINVADYQDLLLLDVARSVQAGVFALPSFQKGVGPFPHDTGYWVRQPCDQISRRALAGLYLALLTGVCLDLIGCREPVVVEGRFADDPVFARALAALHRHPVYKASAAESIAHGALRLVDPCLPSQAQLQRIEPLGIDIAGYAAKWRSMAGASERLTNLTERGA